MNIYSWYFNEDLTSVVIVADSLEDAKAIAREELNTYGVSDATIERILTEEPYLMVKGDVLVTRYVG